MMRLVSMCLLWQMRAPRHRPLLPSKPPVVDRSAAPAHARPRAHLNPLESLVASLHELLPSHLLLPFMLYRLRPFRSEGGFLPPPLQRGRAQRGRQHGPGRPLDSAALVSDALLHEPRVPRQCVVAARGRARVHPRGDRSLGVVQLPRPRLLQRAQRAQRGGLLAPALDLPGRLSRGHPGVCAQGLHSGQDGPRLATVDDAPTPRRVPRQGEPAALRLPRQDRPCPEPPSCRPRSPLLPTRHPPMAVFLPPLHSAPTTASNGTAWSTTPTSV